MIIKQGELKGADADYAIRADKYQTIREKLNTHKGKYNVSDLLDMGGFKVNTWLKPDEIYSEKKGAMHDGWLELFAGKNNASKVDYNQAVMLMKEYVAKSKQQNCFSGGTGMAFGVSTNQNGYVARLWSVGGSYFRSYAFDGDYFWSNFWDGGHFLRVHPDKATEGGAAQKSVTDNYINAYQMLISNQTEAVKRMTPIFLEGLQKIIGTYKATQKP